MGAKCQNKCTCFVYVLGNDGRIKIRCNPQKPFSYVPFPTFFFDVITGINVESSFEPQERMGKKFAPCLIHQPPRALTFVYINVFIRGKKTICYRSFFVVGS